MTPDLTGSDVLAIMNFDSREGFTGDITTPFSARLDGGGAYAVVFGAGSFGAERVQGFVHGGHRRVAGAQLPFTARQSDGIFIDQMGEYRVFVVGNAL